MKRHTVPWRKLAVLIPAALLGAAGGYFFMWALDPYGMTVLLPSLACLILSFWLQAILHEGGHLVCGLLSGLGIGGGTLLMVWMTGVAALPQQTAQGINLLYFLPSAACALFFHIRNRLIRWDIVLPAALGGCVTAAIAAWIATGLDVSLLRRLFGA